MCGIAGVINYKGEFLEKSLQLMSDCLAHRGPDDNRTWVSNDLKAAFSHRRLSIIDLSERASQPMHYLGRYTIVFNGEIYNYIELREWLQRYGYTFSTESDSEVLIALFDYKREKCFDYIDGMFALAIWDDQEKKLFCARDRFGEKPFYFFEKDGTFWFASEIKALHKVIDSIKVNADLLQQYVTNGYKPAPSETFFKNISILPASHYLWLENGRATIKQYWDIDLSKRTRYIRESQYSEHFYELFRKSIYRRLRSQVTVGSSLSGGLDSSAIICLMHEIKQADFKTFSARFSNFLKDEGEWINIAAQHAKAENFQVSPTLHGFLDEAEKVIYHQEFPFASASVYAQFCVMRLAADKKVKVLLDGQGADEYLAGYDSLKYYAIWELYRKGRLLSFRKEMKLLKSISEGQRSVGFKFIYDPILHLLGKQRSVYDKGYSLLERLKYAMKNELPELLRYADRNSMSQSVEVRLPFLNHQLVEFVFSVPPELIYHNGRTKYILREATKNILPQAIYSRTDKIGFASPDNDWKNDSLFKEHVKQSEAYLNDSSITLGTDAFRNFTAGKFLKVFSK